MLWYEQKNDDLIISSRVRFARNLADVPFPSKLDNSSLLKINEDICKKISECDFNGIQLRNIDMDTLGEIEINAMIERHIISPQFAANRTARKLVLSDDESISIMVGEEDHLRIQVLLSGNRLEEAFDTCNMIDDILSQKLNFAYDDKLGFLTACPTNLGTGMRASTMLHLPVLEKNGQLKNIASAAAKIGLIFRGFYGEGSKAKASLYQLSNQITLGVSELSAIENLKNITNQIVMREKDAEQVIEKIDVYDAVCRSLGTLKYAAKLSTDEMMTHISLLMLGTRLGFFENNNFNSIKIIIEMQPAMIRRIHGEKQTSERDLIRAKTLRNSVISVKPKEL